MQLIVQKIILSIYLLFNENVYILKYKIAKIPYN